MQWFVRWACVVFASAGLGCGQEPPGLEAVRNAIDRGPTQAVDWQGEVDSLYQRAKSAGEEVPDDVSDWVAEDFARIGAWEYATVRVTASDPAEMQRVLAERGSERWECFHVLDREDEAVLLFKRNMRSYLGSIPLREMLRLVALGPSLGSDSP